jgi:hypothetical protein
MNAEQMSLGVMAPMNSFQSRFVFGGSLLKNSHAKTARPLSSKRLIHVVLHSYYAKGPYSLLKSSRQIEGLLRNQGKKFGVKIYRVFNGGHQLHILMRSNKRRGLINFLRATTGLIARKVLGAERGRARKWDTAYGKKSNESVEPFSHLPELVIPQGESFWSQRPFTRIVSWGPDFQKAVSLLGKLSKEKKIVGFLEKRYLKMPSNWIKATVLSRLSIMLEKS